LAAQSLFIKQSTSDEPLWVLAQGPHRLHAELHQPRGQGWEVQVFHNGTFRYGERHPTRIQALEEAHACRRAFEAKGWNAAKSDHDLTAIDPFQMFHWVTAHYRAIASGHDFSGLSRFERWVRLRDHVRLTPDPRRQWKTDALDDLEAPLKPQLLEWLDRHADESE
jgi:hypothetical protein